MNAQSAASATPDLSPGRAPVQNNDEAPGSATTVPIPSASSPAEPGSHAATADGASPNSNAVSANTLGIACPDAHAQLARLSYPQGAAEAASGDVLIEFTVTPQSKIEGITVLRPGPAVLERAAVQAVARLRCVGQARPVRVQVPFEFRQD